MARTPFDDDTIPAFVPVEAATNDDLANYRMPSLRRTVSSLLFGCVMPIRINHLMRCSLRRLTSSITPLMASPCCPGDRRSPMTSRAFCLASGAKNGPIDRRRFLCPFPMPLTGSRWCLRALWYSRAVTRRDDELAAHMSATVALSRTSM